MKTTKQEQRNTARAGAGVGTRGEGRWAGGRVRTRGCPNTIQKTDADAIKKKNWCFGVEVVRVSSKGGGGWGLGGGWGGGGLQKDPVV